MAAVEGWFKDGAALSLAEKLGDDRVGVTTTMFPDVSSAVAAAKASGAGIVLVGKSVSGGLFGVEPVGSSTRETAVRLRRFADDGVLTHDSSPDLAEQVLALRVVPSADGVRMASTTRADAAKSACWAVERARTFGGIARIY